MSDLATLLRAQSAVQTILRQRGLDVGGVPSLPPKRIIAPEDTLLNALAWAYKYRRIDDRPFTLERHKPLEQIYADDHPHIVIMKCAQVGASEMAITRAVHALDVGHEYWHTGKEGLNVAYLFPTSKALSDFSKERLSPLVLEHPHLMDLFRGGFDDLGFKQAGRSYLYLRSTWIGGKGKNAAAEQLLSFPADILMLDEYDRMDPAAVELARKRLNASVVNRELNLSTPTIPGHGVHAAYMESDQHQWQIPCPSCGGGVIMDFFRDVYGRLPDDMPRRARAVMLEGATAVPAGGEPYTGGSRDSDGGRAEGGYFGWGVWKTWHREVITGATWAVLCPLCHGPLDRFAPGTWVAQAPRQKSVRGYHLPALAFPSVDLMRLATRATSDDPTQQEEFFRSDLGVPYQVEGTRITDAMLDALPSPVGALPISGLTMGVDVGNVFHVRISGPTPESPGKRTIVLMDTVRSWQALDDLLKRYRIQLCIIDAQPELNAGKDFADSHNVSGRPPRVYRAYYSTDRSLKGVLYRPDPDKGVVYINRSMAMDHLLARIAGRQDLWPRAIIRDAEVRAHLQAPSRTTVMDSSGEQTPVWVNKSADHYFHASLYDTLAPLLAPKQRGSAVVAGSARGW